MIQSVLPIDFASMRLLYANKVDYLLTHTIRKEQVVDRIWALERKAS